MYKLVILNQHRSLPEKGIQELYDHIQSYLTNWCEGIFMYLIIDEILSDRDAIMLSNIESANEDKLTIRYDKVSGKGLSACRNIAYEEFTESPNYSEQTHIMFGCTNCVYIHPLKELLNNLTDRRDIILVPCEYENSVQDIDKKYLNKLSYTFDEYFNAEEKPDYTIILPGIGPHFLRDLKGYKIIDKYYPEEIYIFRAYIYYNRTALIVADKAYQHCWYNKGGLSESFGRKSMIESSYGFSERARFFLQMYIDGLVTLSYSKLKNLVYEYITLSKEVNTKWLQNTCLEPLVYYALQRWVDNPEHFHSFSFNEN